MTPYLDGADAAVRLESVISLVTAESTGCPLEMDVRFGQENSEQIHHVAAARLSIRQKSCYQYALAQVQK